MRIAASLALIWIAFAAAALSARAEPVIPNFWDARERLPKPDLSELTRLRFLTTTDFPPFSFLDPAGRITGFHVDLARAICAELEIVERCQIQALPWEELQAALDRGEGEAIIAGLSVSAETRQRLSFSRPYMRFPARFITQKPSDMAEPLHVAASGKRIGVMAGSGHERMLREYFPQAQAVTYSRAGWLYDALREGKVDAAFGDGMRFAFWLAGSDAAGCCRFAGGPYLAPEYLGPGLAIAVSPENAELTEAFDYALGQIHAKGVFAELYLRYFPVSFF